MKTTFPVEKKLAERFRDAVKKKHGSNYRFVSIEVEEMFDAHIKKLESVPRREATTAAEPPNDNHEVN